MRRSLGCMLTLGHNYSSPVHSSLVLGRYLTPWRVPEFQRSVKKKKQTIQHNLEKDNRRRAAAAYRESIQQNDYNPCELGKPGVFLPQVSEEMASAVAVAAKD